LGRSQLIAIAYTVILVTFVWLKFCELKKNGENANLINARHGSSYKNEQLEAHRKCQSRYSKEPSSLSAPDPRRD